MLGRWVEAIGVREGERARVARLFSFIFLITAAAVCAKSAQRGIFLAAYPRERIPDAFLLSAVCLAVVSLGTSALAARLGLGGLMQVVTLAVAAAFAWTRVGLAFGHVGGPLALYVIVDVGVNILLVQSWSFVAEALDVRSAKRLLPLVGTGAGLAWTVGGFAVKPLVVLVGAEGVLMVSPALLFACLVMLQWIVRRDLSARRGVPPQRRARDLGATLEGIRYIAQQPLMRVMAVSIVLDLLVEQVTDFQLFAFAQHRFAGVPGGIAAFMGTFYGATGGLILIAPFVYSAFVLSKLGSTRSILAAPLWTLGFAAALLIDPSFGLIVLLAGGDRILKQSLTQPGRGQIFSIVPAVRRAQASAILRGVLGALFGALGAVALKAVAPHLPTAQLAVATVVMSAILLLVIQRRLGKSYVLALQRSLDQRRLDLDAPGSSQLRALDREQYLLLREELRSPDPDRAGFAVSLISQGEPEAARALLREALAHPSAEVGARAVAALAAYGMRSDAAAVAPLLSWTDHEGLRCAVLLALANLGAVETRQMVEPLCAFPSPRSRAMALACLARFDELASQGGPPSHALAGLEAMLTSTDPKERAAAAWAAGTVPLELPHLHQRLTTLMGDESSEVRREAVVAAARFDDPSIVRQLMLALAEPVTAPAAFDAFARLKNAALVRVEEALPHAPAPVVSQTAAALARGEATQASALLGRMLGHRDAAVRYRAAKALALRRKMRGWAPPPQDLVRRVVQTELDVGYRYYTALIELAEQAARGEQTDGNRFIAGEIDSRIRQTERRLLALLALASEQRIARMANLLRDSSPQVAARALELVEQSLSRELAAEVVPFLERQGGRASQPDRSAATLEPADPLPRLLSLGDEHLRRCAILAFRDRIAAEHPELLKQEGPVLHLVERIRFLRQVPLFKDLTPEDLMKLAEIADPVDHHAGQVVFRKGDPGDVLCVILRGRVEIRDGAQVIASQGANEFFGDLAVLDDEPRSADAVCVEDTSLLQIGAADLDELMERRPEIAREIIRVLARRLRRTTQAMVTAGARAAAATSSPPRPAA